MWRTLTWLITAALTLGCPAIAVADQEEQVLLNACQKLDDAFVTRDRAAIRRYCDPKHITLTTRYRFFGLSEQLSTLDELQLTSNRAGEKTVTWMSPDAAVVTYQATLVGTYAGQTIDSTVQILTSWVLRDRRWVQMSYQETPINEPS